MGELIYADEIHRVKQSQIDAARITQASGNERRGAETALSQFSASLANMRRMDAAGEAINDITSNTARIMDKAVAGKMSSRIQAAEELGMVAAMAGSAGVGGGSLAKFNERIKLSNAIREQAADREVDTIAHNSGRQRANQIKNATAMMDNNVYRANLDYTQYVDHKKPSFIEQTVGIGLTAAATYFGGPQAGAAVMGVFESRQAARNGDYGSASNAAMGAIQNGIGAISSHNATRAPGTSSEGEVISSKTADEWEYATTSRQRGADSSQIIGGYKHFGFNNNVPQYGSVTIR